MNRLATISVANVGHLSLLPPPSRLQTSDINTMALAYGSKLAKLRRSSRTVSMTDCTSTVKLLGYDSPDS